jgi:hypothetical protein
MWEISIPSNLIQPYRLNMSLNGLVSAIVAILSVSIALVLSPWNIASLGTSLEIDTTASVVREKVRLRKKQMRSAIRLTKRH